MIVSRQFIEKAYKDAERGIFDDRFKNDHVYVFYHDVKLKQMRGIYKNGDLPSDFSSLSSFDIARAKNIAIAKTASEDGSTKYQTNKYLDSKFVQFLYLEKGIDLKALQEEFKEREQLKKSLYKDLVIFLIDQYQASHSSLSVIDARAIKYFFLRYKLDFKLQTIANMFYEETRKETSKKPDHSTIVDALQALSVKVEVDKVLTKHLENIKKTIDQQVPLKNFYPH